MSIGRQKTKEEGFVNVSTKVPTHVADFLNIVAKSRGTDIYGLLQLFIQTLIRAAKCTTSITPEMKTMLHLIEMDKDWNKAFNFASPSATTEIAQIILILQQYDGTGVNRTPRKGHGLVMIQKTPLPDGTPTTNYQGDDINERGVKVQLVRDDEKPTINYCVDDILERVAEVSMHGLYTELRQVVNMSDSGSLREALTILCDAYVKESIEQMDADEMPQLGNFHDFGKIIEYGARTKQKKHRTPDSISMEQPILFDDFDREAAYREVCDALGTSPDEPMGNIKPFTEEP